ncbi:unnamed protein product, partial [marine sediment metagenome]
MKTMETMDTFKKILYKCLSYLECDFNIFKNNKRERIKAQKYSYILQNTLGLQVGKFSLYLNGPYSASLADDLFDIADHQEELSDNMTVKPLKKGPKVLLDKIKEIFILEDSAEPEEVDLLELYTTYDFLKENFP